MTKEVASYEKEALQNEAKIQKMRDENKDEYGLLTHLNSHFLLHD